MRVLRMYRFRYSPDGGKHWVLARYRELAPEIRMRHPDHELLDVERRVNYGHNDTVRAAARVTYYNGAEPPLRRLHPKWRIVGECR
jgi:hypothetical protein